MDPSSNKPSQLEVWVADASFVLDQLVQLADDDPEGEIGGHLDVTKLGMFGVSFGGMTALTVAALDPRVTAGVDMDGMPFDVVGLGAFTTPVLIFSSDHEDNGTWAAILDQAAGDAYLIKVLGAVHANFQDSAFTWTALTGLGPVDLGFGPIDPARSLDVINAYDVAFFDEYLGGAPSPLLDSSSSDYAEAELTTNH